MQVYWVAVRCFVFVSLLKYRYFPCFFPVWWNLSGVGRSGTVELGWVRVDQQLCGYYRPPNRTDAQCLRKCSRERKQYQKIDRYIEFPAEV